jgi:hypothetical protein
VLLRAVVCCCCLSPFAQVTATGYLNWGNVHLCKGHKALDVAALEGQELSKELLDKVRQGALLCIVLSAGCGGRGV